MTVHAGAGPAEGGTLVNALLHRYRSLSSVGGEQRPGIVHRLDKQTSGLIVIARNDAAHARLAQMFAQRQMRKTYIALVHGHLKQDRGTIDAPIARDLLRRTRMTTAAQTSEHARRFRITRCCAGSSSRFGAFTLVSVRIETGRTHQIRVHLASIGHPVVGDTRLRRARATDGHSRTANGRSQPPKVWCWGAIFSTLRSWNLRILARTSRSI